MKTCLHIIHVCTCILNVHVLFKICNIIYTGRNLIWIIDENMSIHHTCMYIKCTCTIKHMQHNLYWVV